MELDYLPELPDLDLLRAAGRDGAPGQVVTGLITATRDGDEGFRVATADILGSWPARTWVAVDEELRERWWWAPVWTVRLAERIADGSADLLCLVVVACHGDGWIREAAVARLAEHVPHPAALAVLALRCADWVEQVRARARTTVDERGLAAGAALAVLAGTAYGLRARRHGGWLVERVERLLRELPSDGLEPLLTAPDHRTRRAAYRAALATGRLGQRQLVTAAVRDGDPPIRAMCARAAVVGAGPEALRELLASRTALVRAEALRALTMAGDQAAAETALLDRHPVVRATAQAMLHRAGADPVAGYRDLVGGHEPPAPAAIAGLGETGRAEDAGLLTRWLAHPRPRGRAETVRALRRLGVARQEDLLPLLGDRSGAVTRQVVTTLRHGAGSLDPAMVTGLTDPGNPPHVRFAGYRLLISGGAWQRVATDLRLLDDADERLRGAVRADLAMWLQRQAATTYDQPGPRLAAELDRLIERARPVLGEHRVRLLRFHAGLSADPTKLI
ncbi:hypothetical protein AB0M79_17710 [Polymorphospora sp. NPDC051019]|uniref:hypothetical protein n=1 Tax=Polymorphospora sp. NPDC051019 TaxID=3155725 RepID=UPI0034353A12